MSCFQVTCKTCFPVFDATLMLNPFALCCLNTSLCITSGLCVNQHNIIIHQSNTHKQLRESLSERICWLMKPFSVSSPWNGNNRVIIQMWRKFPLPSYVLWPGYTLIFCLIIILSLWVTTLSAEPDGDLREDLRGQTQTHCCCHTHEHTYAHDYSHTPHTFKAHTLFVTSFLSLLHTHSHNLCRPTKICQRVCMGFTSFTRAKERVAKFGDQSPSCHLTF